MSEIIVLGAGAVGSLFGARLARQNNVTLIGRAAHVGAINSAGLRIEGIDAETVRLPAATEIAEIAPDSLILLTTKLPASAAALAPLAPLIRADTTVVCLQNGLGAEELARTALPDRGLVLRAVTQLGVIFERPGVIRYMAAGETILEDHPRSAALAAALEAVGLEARLSSKIAVDIWRKLIFNCVVNPITAMLGCEVGAIADPALDPLKKIVIDEALAVAAAEGVHPEGDLLARLNELYAGSSNLVSMRQDLLRGRPTEIDYLNGAVANLGAKHGLPCPVNRALADIIRAMEAAAPREKS